MRFGIQFKLVVLLLLVGVLPLLAALVVLVADGGRVRTRTLGQSFQATARTQSAQLELLLRYEAEKFILSLDDEVIIRQLIAANLEPVVPQRIEDLDARWPDLPENSPEISALLNNLVAQRLRYLQRSDAQIHEIIVTDIHGRLIAASIKPSDYFQADELWWQRAYSGGQGSIYISPVVLDESAQLWGIDVSVPIFDPLADMPRLVGIAKAFIGLENWLAETISFVAETQGDMFLIDEQGTILYGAGIEPMSANLKDWRGPNGRLPRWTVVADRLRASARIDVGVRLADWPIDAPVWHLVIETPAREALYDIYRLSFIVLAVGLGLIGLMFGLGLYVANRNIVKPLAQLRAATERVAAGDLSQRVIDLRNRLGANDEIGQLALDFDRMIIAVESSQTALSAANEAKSRFIRVAGHELRTPVSYILSMTTLLIKTAPSDAVRSAAEKLAAKARRLDDIIGQMFKLLSEEQIETMIRYSSFSPRKLVDDVIAELRPFLDSRRQNVEVRADEEIPDIQADPEKIHDAILNLMTNAVKFTPDAGVIHVALETHVGHRIAIRIRDEGCGISPEEFPHIFEPFWGAPDLLKHSSGEFGYQKRGPGLGLAIARHFVRLHGGQIQVNSTPQGCEFTILLPIAPPAREQPTSA